MSVRAHLGFQHRLRSRPKLEPLENRTTPAVLTEGHVDIGIAYENDAWDLHVHDETNDVEYEPGEALLFLGPNTKTAQPANGYRFIGAGPGNPIWVLPQVQGQGMLLLGFGAEEIVPGTFASYFEPDGRIQSEGEWIRMKLVDVRGPQGGKFSVWQTDSFGSPTIWMATNTVRPPDSAFVRPGGHADMNFAFTKTGIYEVDFRASAYLGPGMTNQVVSDVVTYFFGVEDCGSFCPPAPLPDGSGVPIATLLTSNVGRPQGLFVIHEVSPSAERDCSPLTRVAVEAPAKTEHGVFGGMANHAATAVIAPATFLEALSLEFEALPK